MPVKITPENIEAQEAAYADMRDNADGSIPMEAVDALSTRIREYRDAENLTVNQNDTNGNIDDQETELPVKWEPDRSKRRQFKPPSGLMGGVGGMGIPSSMMYPAMEEVASQPMIWHEPSLEKARAALSDPANMAALGYGPGETFTPEALDRITEDSVEYKKYADNLYSQALMERKESEDGRGIVRFSKIGFGDDPMANIRGQALEYGTPFASGMDDAVLFGAGKAAMEAVAPGSTEEMRDLSRKHPYVDAAGNIAGNILPGGAAATAARAGTKIAGYGAAKAAAQGAGKVISKDMVKRGAAAGAATAVLEGEGMDLVAGAGRKLGGGDFYEGDLGEELEKRAVRTGLGLGLGVVGEGLGGLLHKGSKMITENPKISNELKVFREGGGETHMGLGLKPTEAMERNVFKATQPGPNNEIMGTAEDVAAKELAGKVKGGFELKQKTDVSRLEQADAMYQQSPEGLEEVSMAPLVDSLTDAINSKFKSTELGGMVNQQSTVTKQLVDRLQSVSDRVEMPLEEAQALIEQNPGLRMHSVHEAERIWPSGKQLPTSEIGKNRVVFVPLKQNAKGVEDASIYIDSLMRDPKNQGGEKEALVLAQKGIKTIRDQFKPNKHTPKSATLDDGTVVTGYSALKRQHHEARNALETAEAHLGTAARDSPVKRLQSYQRPGTHPEVSESIKKQAKELGLEEELEDMAGTIAYQRLRGLEDPTSGGIRQTILRKFAFMADPAMRFLADVPSIPRQSAQNMPNPLVGGDLALDQIVSPKLFKLRGGNLARGSDYYDRQERKKVK